MEDTTKPPADLANFTIASSIVLSTALRAAGSREHATDIQPFWSNSFVPGWVSSMFLKKISRHTKYLQLLRPSKAKKQISHITISFVE